MRINWIEPFIIKLIYELYISSDGLSVQTHHPRPGVDSIHLFNDYHTGLQYELRKGLDPIQELATVYLDFIYLGKPLATTTNHFLVLFLPCFRIKLSVIRKARTVALPWVVCTKFASHTTLAADTSPTTMPLLRPNALCSCICINRQPHRTSFLGWLPHHFMFFITVSTFARESGMKTFTWTRFCTLSRTR